MISFNQALSVYSKQWSNLRKGTSALLLCLLTFGVTGNSFAVDAPENIRLEGDVIRWDPVENAVNYNVYFLTRPVVDTRVSPMYVATVDNALEFTLTLEGFYTVVTVAMGDSGLEFSDVADGATVSFNGSGNVPNVVTINNVLQIRTTRCDNVVAGGSCESQCSFASRSNPTGGACRADTGVVLHQRAGTNGFECISQNDTSFVEADVYCLSTGNL